MNLQLLHKKKKGCKNDLLRCLVELSSSTFFSFPYHWFTFHFNFFSFFFFIPSLSSMGNWAACSASHTLLHARHVTSIAYFFKNEKRKEKKKRRNAPNYTWRGSIPRPLGNTHTSPTMEPCAHLWFISYPKIFKPIKYLG